MTLPARIPHKLCWDGELRAGAVPSTLNYESVLNINKPFINGNKATGKEGGEKKNIISLLPSNTSGALGNNKPLVILYTSFQLNCCERS